VLSLLAVVGLVALGIGTHCVIKPENKENQLRGSRRCKKMTNEKSRGHRVHLTKEGDVIKCPKCRIQLSQKAIDYPLLAFVGGTRIQRDNGTLGDWYICVSQICEDGVFNSGAIKRWQRGE